jgi:hypothetical protein
MGSGAVVPAAATAVVDYDMLTGGEGPRFSRMNGVDRVITSIGLCGSAAAGDAGIRLYVEDTYYGNFYNITTGYPTKDHFVPVTIPVPAGQQIRAVVFDAAGTNPLNLVLTWDEYPKGTLGG